MAPARTATPPAASQRGENSRDPVTSSDLAGWAGSRQLF
jgi:hypothetical protein